LNERHSHLPAASSFSRSSKLHSGLPERAVTDIDLGLSLTPDYLGTDSLGRVMIFSLEWSVDRACPKVVPSSPRPFSQGEKGSML
jgi:hypothetical protein